jgi:hypothetical protein
MPAKGKYDEVVINALNKDGWKVLEDPFTLYVKNRHLIAVPKDAYNGFLTESIAQNALK